VSELDRALKDLYHFCVEFIGLELYETPHREVCEAIQQGEMDPDTPYTLVTIPRGYYKTSIARSAAIWKQLRQIKLYDNLYHRLVFASATLPLSEMSMRWVEGQMKHNKKLTNAFGELVVYDRKTGMYSRTESGLTLAPRLRKGEIATVAEPSFFVGSIERISTGFHADGAILDDLNNDKNSATDVQREKVKDYYRMVYPILGPVDRNGNPTTVIMTCTPYHDDDCRGMIVREEGERAEADKNYKSKWKTLWRSAVTPEGEAYWPEKYPLEVLEELRVSMSTYKFACNYLCDPIGKKGFVAEDEIVWKPRADFPPMRDMRATVDPNQHFDARAAGCYAAIMVSGYDAYAQLYFHDARGSRDWNSAELIDQLFKVNEDYPDIPIYIEDNNQSHLDHAIMLEEANRSQAAGKRIMLRINWVHAETESKYEKWLKLQPRFRNRRVFFASEINWKMKMEIRDELVRGQAARFHDFLDAMALAETGVYPKIAKDGKMAPIEEKRKPFDPAAPTFADVFPGLVQ
jgi:hypothetical protein